jgi:ABC-type Na+ efflux pump permease subunit
MGKSRIWFFLFFAMAVYALSRSIAWGNSVVERQDSRTLLVFLVWVVVLLASFFMAAFQIYRQEKARGNVHKPVGIFEKMIRPRKKKD